MNRKLIVIFSVLLSLSPLLVSCNKSTQDNSANSARTVADSANSIANSAKSIENSANSIAESARIITNSTKTNANLAVSNTNSTISGANLVKTSPTSYRNSVESDITSKRNAECIRQRTAAGLDTSPCSDWAEER